MSLELSDSEERILPLKGQLATSRGCCVCYNWGREWGSSPLAAQRPAMLLNILSTEDSPVATLGALCEDDLRLFFI